MPIISPFLAATLIAVPIPAPSAQEVLEAWGSCYDAALVGVIVETEGFQSLNDIRPLSENVLSLGGVSSVLVRKLAQLIGQSEELGWVKMSMSA